MNIVERYLKPLANILDRECDEIKPVDLLIITTYLTVVVPVACIAVAILYNYTWRHIPNDGMNGYTHFAKKILADGGNANAQFQLAFFYNNYAETSGDYSYKVKAADYYKRAADQGHHDAQYQIALLYFNASEEDGDPKTREALNITIHDYEIAKNYFTLAVVSSDYVNYYLGKIASKENKPDDAIALYELTLKSSLYSYRDLARSAVALEYYKKGMALKNSDVDEDKVKAFEYFEKSANFDNADAQVELSICYEKGYGVQKDFNKELNTLKIAANKGHALSQNRLKALFDGFNKGADQGNADDQCNLGYFYGNGLACERNDARAQELYIKSAEQGNMYAQHNLGYFYANGIVVKKDLSLAKEWYQKAADQGLQVSIDALKII